MLLRKVLSGLHPISPVRIGAVVFPPRSDRPCYHVIALRSAVRLASPSLSACWHCELIHSLDEEDYSKLRQSTAQLWVGDPSFIASSDKAHLSFSLVSFSILSALHITGLG
jgi:hypothetical protein